MLVIFNKYFLIGFFQLLWKLLQFYSPPLPRRSTSCNAYVEFVLKQSIKVTNVTRVFIVPLSQVLVTLLLFFRLICKMIDIQIMKEMCNDGEIHPKHMRHSCRWHYNFIHFIYCNWMVVGKGWGESSVSSWDGSCVRGLGKVSVFKLLKKVLRFLL